MRHRLLAQRMGQHEAQDDERQPDTERPADAPFLRHPAEQRRPEQEDHERVLGEGRDVDHRRPVRCAAADTASGNNALVPTPQSAKPSSESCGTTGKKTISVPTRRMPSSTRATPSGECRSTKPSAKKRITP